MDEKITTFGNNKIEKHKFYCHKNPILIDGVDINKIIVSDKLINVSNKLKNIYKYFICEKDNKKVRPFCVMLPKKNEYRKKISETKCVSFLIKDDELLKK